jgi:uncharacterized protein YlxW (UPF0749 family)
MPFRAVDYQDTLEASGVPPAQARARARAMEQFITRDTVSKSHFDTKLDNKVAEIFFKMSEVEAHLRAHTSELDSKLQQRIAELDKDLQAKIATLDRQLATTTAETAQKIAETNQRIGELKFEMIRWVVGMVSASGIAILLAIIRYGRP